MVNTADILTALEGVVTAAITGLNTSADPKRKDFTRPAAYVEHIRTTESGDNRKLVHCMGYWLITLFPELNEYRDCSQEALYSMQDKTLQALRSGRLVVGDRSLGLKASTGGSSDDRAFVDIQLDYFDARSDTADTTPLMGAVKTNLKEES